MQFLPPTESTAKNTYTLFQNGDISQADVQNVSTSFDAMLDQSRSNEQQFRETASTVRNDPEEQGRNTPSQESLRSREVDREDAGSFRHINDMREKDTSPGEIAMTGADVEAMRKNLKKQGFSDDEIDELQDRASEGGLTWNDFISALQEKFTAIAENASHVDLSQEDRNHLLSFFQKVGFGPKKSEQLVKDITDGKGAQVMKELQTKLSQLSGDARINVGKNELQSLSKAFGVSDETAQKIASLLKQAGNDGMMPDAIKNAVALLQKDVSEQGQDKLAALRDLQKDIQSLLDKAMNRDAQGQSDSAKQIQAKKDETAAEQFLGKKDDDTDEAGQNKNSAADADDKDPRNKDSKEGAKSAKRTAAEELRAKLARNGKGAKDDDTNNVRNDADDAPVPDSDATPDLDKELDTFFNKITSRLDGNGLNLSKQAGQSTDASQAARTNLFDSKSGQAEILRQLESGVLKGASNGARQLTIQLKPVELGTIQVMLNQSQNGDLKAVIRTENADVSRVVSEQLAHVRETLAQQGVKVNELEVQTGLNRDFMNQQWNGQQQHNMDAEREAMARLRTRMRNLRGQGQAANISQEHQPVSTRRLIGQGSVHYVA